MGFEAGELDIAGYRWPMKSITIGDKLVGTGQPCFIIAEAGVNHNGDIELAKRLIDIAVEVGADAVKFQTFKAEELVSISAPKADYQLQTTDGSESQLAMLRRLELSLKMHKDLISYCENLGILFISTPFDPDSADLLVDLGLPVFKIPSGEITNHKLLEHVAHKGLPIILSTGMSNLTEVGQAVGWIKDMGNDEIILLHCVSNYPASPSDSNLRAMGTMRTAFQVPVGYSDHTPGIEVSLAAVALGASVIEKHFTLDKNLPGPDHRASLEPKELDSLVQGIRVVEACLGHGRKEPAVSEANTAAVARRSLVAEVDIPAGTKLAEKHIALKRPGTGLPPSMYSHLIGLTLREDISAGTLFSMEMFS